ncbi:hypothetical protein DPEC_G00022320 [Dallia pectoralis]|uniref:Uncharacterized protein n=1 Tax=Dallia pectoralis TaxID=75939 RepID=A0ACC2HGE2_DALPE|nr:hypothetical protein DPEC_G00022320 [Dallia pectoralis]
MGFDGSLGDRALGWGICFPSLTLMCFDLRQGYVAASSAEGVLRPSAPLSWGDGALRSEPGALYASTAHRSSYSPTRTRMPASGVGNLLLLPS